jgi:hypothetical protein
MEEEEETEVKDPAEREELVEEIVDSVSESESESESESLSSDI